MMGFSTQMMQLIQGIVFLIFVAVFADPDERTAKVVVPDYQLSLAIGKEGQNARLAARLTGYKIDIKSETQAASEQLDEHMSEVEVESDESFTAEGE